MQVGLPAPAPPAQVNVHTDVTLQVPEPDPQAVGDMAGWSFSGIVVTIIAPTLLGWTNSLLDVPDFYRTTPPDLTYKNDAVRAMSDIVRKAALALMGLALVAWAVRAMNGGGESPGRIVYGAALALGNLLWWQWGIELNNAICREIAAPELGSIVRPHLTLPTLTQDPAQAFAPALLVIATAIVSFALLFSMLLRLAMVDVLIVVGALALFCKAADGSERFAETYAGWATGTLFSQIMVVVTLKLAIVLGVVTGGVAGTLLTLAVLWLTKSMPGVLASRLGQSGGGIGKLVGAGLRMVRRA
jgi:hypothetical protein